MDEEPPEGGGVREALWVELLRVVIGGGGKDGLYYVACEFFEFDSLRILEEVSPGETETWRFMGVDGGYEGEASGPLMWVGVGMGIGC